jgi:hypothetical protein
MGYVVREAPAHSAIDTVSVLPMTCAGYQEIASSGSGFWAAISPDMNPGFRAKRA